MRSILSPGCSLPSSAARPLGAMLRTYTGLFPWEELTPPTRLKPRDSVPLRCRMISTSTGLCTERVNSNFEYNHNVFVCLTTTYQPKVLISGTCHLYLMPHLWCPDRASYLSTHLCQSGERSAWSPWIISILMVEADMMVLIMCTASECSLPRRGTSLILRRISPFCVNNKGN